MRLLLALLLALATPLLAQEGQEGSGGSNGTWFTTPTLNEGLGEVPPWIDRDTPQGTVESFLDAFDAGDLDAAAHLLNLNGIRPEHQRSEGRVLASELHTVLERSAVVTWRTLLERPDALDANQTSNAAMAGKPRRSLLLSVLRDGSREAAIRLSRIRPDGGDPVWVFSERTVSQIPSLYDTHGPSKLERALPEWLKGETILGLRTWEIVVIPLMILVSTIAGRLTWRVFRALSRGAGGYWRRVTLKAVRWPLIVVVSTSVILVAARTLFTVSGWVGAIVTPLVLVGYIVAVIIFLVSVIDTALDRMVTFDAEKLSDPDNSRLRRMATILSAARRVAIVLGLFAGIGIVLSSTNVFRTLGFSLLASAGALTLIVGFAGREVLGNIMSSLQIALNQSARIGDRVLYDDIWCRVERINFTYVQLATWDDNRIIVPVSEFTSESFQNWSMVRSGMICSAVFTFAHEADVGRMREIFLAMIEDHPEVDVDDDAKVLVLEQDAFGKRVRFQFRCPNDDTFWETECEIREQLLAEAARLEREEGLTILPRVGLDEDAG